MQKIILIILFFIFSCGEVPPLPERGVNHNKAPQVVSLCFIDVGQGDSTVLTTPAGNLILIDAGTANAGIESVVPFIVQQKKPVKLIIASHYDADHIGGITEVLKGNDGTIGTEDDIIPEMGILDRGDAVDIDSVAWSNYFVITHPYRFTVKAGETLSIDEMEITILGVNGEFADGRSVDISGGSENTNSISLLIRYGGFTYLTSGDLPGPNFENIYEPYDLEKYIADIAGDVDILHVSHHGSHMSTNPEFLEKIKPEIAIISVGENDYGHPSETVLTNLQKAGVKIYRTDVSGTFCLPAPQ